MTWLLHALAALAASALLWRGLQQAWVESFAADEAVATTLPIAFALGSGLASLAAIVAGRFAGARRMLVADAASFAGSALVVSIIAAGPASRDVVGVFLVGALAMRVAPSAIVVVTRAVPARVAFLAALAAYAPLAVWLTATSLPFGDQVHYLLATDRLAHGTIDATIDAGLFRSLIGADPGEADAATHVIQSPAGPRAVQGYAIPLVLLPGWLLAQRTGAHLVMALLAAWTSAQMYLLLRETAPAPAARLTWALASFLAPLVLLATHLYPNIVGAALIVTGYRLLFTAQARRPALGGAAVAATLLLTPRDGLALFTLAPFALWPALVGWVMRSRETAQRQWPGVVGWVMRSGETAQRQVSAAAASEGSATEKLGVDAADGDRVARTDRARVSRAESATLRRRTAFAIGGVALIAVAANAVSYGIPAPYVGYVFGTAAAQTLTNEPSITYRFWVSLPAILFDRVLGIAGTAPWIFIGLLGLAPGLRAAPRVLLPAALTVGASVAALSFYRLWEGGYAPPNRYFVDVLPLWAPFVAYGLGLAWRAQAPEEHAPPTLALLRTWPLRAVVIALIAFSVLAAFVLSAIPSAALNSAFDARLQAVLTPVLGMDLLALLPSFQPIAPDWVIQAYARTILLALLAAVLVWLGAREQGARPLAARKALE